MSGLGWMNEWMRISVRLDIVLIKINAIVFKESSMLGELIQVFFLSHVNTHSIGCKNPSLLLEGESVEFFY